MNHLLCIIAVSTLLLASMALQAAPTTKPATRPASLLPDGVRAEQNLRYGEAPGKSNLLDLYLPESAPDSPRPLLIWIHGGAWKEGDKAGCPAVAMVPRGYIVASLNYRLSQEAIYPAQIQDCKGAIRWLRAHAKEYHIDTERVGVWGASAGGHLVALLGTTGEAKELEGTVGGNLDQSSRVQAVCDWFGPTDMAHYYPESADGTPAKKPAKKTPITELFGGDVEDHKELVAQANPITFISKNAAPFLIMHGAKDSLVPVAQSQMLNDALKRAGIECTLEILPYAGHGNGFGMPQLIKVAEFFDKHLKPTAK